MEDGKRMSREIINGKIVDLEKISADEIVELLKEIQTKNEEIEIEIEKILSRMEKDVDELNSDNEN